MNKYPPKTKLGHAITYIPLTFSVFIISSKLNFLSQGVSISELGYWQFLFSKIDYIISIYLIMLVLFVRCHKTMIFLLISGWSMSLFTLIIVSGLNSMNELSEKVAAVYCIITTLISFILGWAVYRYSMKHQKERCKRHRIAATALISYSITLIFFMFLLL